MSKNERSLNKLKSLVGAEVYVKLLNILAGETVYFPAAGTTNTKQERNRSIIEDYQEGRTYKELAELYGLSESQVRRIITEV